MEQLAFREFMKRKAIQKTIIFADAFNLRIDAWHPSNNSEYPYRIVFYNGYKESAIPVGYIDLIVERGLTNWYETDMPVVLYTPFGKINASFNSDYNLFKYMIDKRDNDFNNIDGYFKVDGNSGNYNIGVLFNLRDAPGKYTTISFNQLTNNYLISIGRKSNGYEEVIMSLWGRKLNIWHAIYPKPNIEENLSSVSLDIETEEIKTTYRFMNRTSYTKSTISENKSLVFRPRSERLGTVNFDEIYSEIYQNDPRMKEFIDEIRNSLTLLANGTTPVSIYDRLVGLCFSQDCDAFKFKFTRANKTTLAPQYSRILKKMNKK